MKRFVASALVVVLAVVLVGCLAFETKEYYWKLNRDGSGEGKIVWRNIFSTGNSDEEDYTADDFASLINDYYEGETLEDENPGFRKVKKRLFVENGVICGEITFEFDEISDIGFYRYKGEGPLMFYLGGFDETFESSNGDWGGDDFPIVFWSEGTKKCELVTSGDDPYDEGAESIMDYYEQWKKDGTVPETGEYDYDDSGEENPANRIKRAIDN
ncbi:hypothetical protein DRQ36_08465 [bacterium]|nr:MAG: hypothetical protein DRQ36_08465 [bacterium]